MPAKRLSLLSAELALVAFALLGPTACGSPPAAPPEPAPVTGPAIGVQCINHARGAATFTVTATRGDKMLTLLRSMPVPAAREPVDPALGGDPAALPCFQRPLAEGPWTLHVTEERSGRRATIERTSGAPQQAWLLVWFSGEDLRLQLDSGPRLLE